MISKPIQMSKKPNNMKPTSMAVKAALFEPVLLKNMVEKLAHRRRDIGYSRERVQPGYHSIETSSVEAHVSGVIQFSGENRVTNMPFVTSFVFTCIKRKDEDYMLTWASSLS